MVPPRGRGLQGPTATPSRLGFDGSRLTVSRGARVLARGVGSDFRLGVSPTPLVFERAEGPYLYDVDGNRLVDYYLGMGPMVLGHAPTSVVDAVRRQVGELILCAGQSRVEYAAADLVCSMVPSAERVRFGSSGSEMIQAALRLARAATGRTAVVKFEGHYHGWFDNVLRSHAPSLDAAGPSEHPDAVTGSGGQLASAADGIDRMAWNDLAAVEGRLRAGDVAAVVMEPVMCNTSAVWPVDGYLEGVRRACDATGTVLVFDEVITGFRLAAGGAQALLGVTPDLAVFGKAIANGFPVACLCGRADLMELLGGGVVHAGTYNGQAVAMAATLLALRDGDVYEQLGSAGTSLMAGITERLQRHGVTAQVQGPPAAFHVAFGVDRPILNYRDAAAADRAAYVAFTTALLGRGVRALERGTWFLSAAHTGDDIEYTLDAVDDVLAAAA